jgi:hypothetical protein
LLASIALAAIWPGGVWSGVYGYQIMDFLKSVIRIWFMDRGGEQHFIIFYFRIQS